MSAALTIFVVENHKDTLTYLTRYLEQKGHSVQGARSIKDAREALAKSPADVLISDIGLPDGDGWEFMRSLNPKPFGIAMSGFGAAADCLKSRSAGYRHHLIKPFLPDSLDVMLEAAAEELSCR